MLGALFLGSLLLLFQFLAGFGPWVWFTYSRLWSTEAADFLDSGGWFLPVFGSFFASLWTLLLSINFVSVLLRISQDVLC